MARKITKKERKQRKELEKLVLSGTSNEAEDIDYALSTAGNRADFFYIDDLVETKRSAESPYPKGRKERAFNARRNRT